MASFEIVQQRAPGKTILKRSPEKSSRDDINMGDSRKSAGAK
jgi:hypothetical protein